MPEAGAGESLVWTPVFPALPPPERIDLYRLPLRADGAGDLPEQDWSLLSLAERERANRFVRPADRHRFVATHAWLRRLLAAALETAPEQLVFITHTHGKPSLGGCWRGHALRFNLSHTQQWAVAALAQGREVGVDVECLRPGLEWQRIVTSFFALNEAAELATLPFALRPRAFLAGWTAKEAYLKGLGVGIAQGLRSCEMWLHPDAPARLRWTQQEGHGPFAWSLQTLNISPDHVATVAAEGHQWRMTACELLAPPAA